MATKKGIIVTVIILASITAASFLVWLIPQNTLTNFVITDFGAHLDDVKEIHLAIQSAIDEDFQKLLDKEISSKEYIDVAEISSSQVNAQIMTLVESNAPSEWYDSYLNYIESLKKFNLQIRETIVVASMIDEGKESTQIQDSLDKIELLKMDSGKLAMASDDARP